MKVTLFECERYTLLNALGCAQVQWEHDAERADMPQRLREQFKRQALQAKALYEKLESAENIQIKTGE